MIPLPSGVTSVGVVVDPSILTFDPSDPRELIDWIARRDRRVADELSAASPLPDDFHMADIEAYLTTPCFSENRWAVIGHAAVNTKASVAGLLVSICVAWVTVQAWGALGGCWALLLGSVVSAAIQLVAFIKFTSSASS